VLRAKPLDTFLKIVVKLSFFIQTKWLFSVFWRQYLNFYERNDRSDWLRPKKRHHTTAPHIGKFRIKYYTKKYQISLFMICKFNMKITRPILSQFQKFKKLLITTNSEQSNYYIKKLIKCNAK
jgi:hypothetical protein